MYECETQIFTYPLCWKISNEMKLILRHIQHKKKTIIPGNVGNYIYIRRKFPKKLQKLLFFSWKDKKKARDTIFLLVPELYDSVSFYDRSSEPFFTSSVCITTMISQHTLCTNPTNQIRIPTVLPWIILRFETKTRIPTARIQRKVCDTMTILIGIVRKRVME